jgi:hypothetical protein
MAVNDSRSMNSDLRKGAVDGKFKSLTPDRGGVVDPTSAAIRQSELNIQYNIQTTPLPEMPESHL